MRIFFGVGEGGGGGEGEKDKGGRENFRVG